ncbi:MAG: ArgR family transcriptional regulator [Coriobacteriaceae bacterium]|nr:ArgR family transcriptional regulator [Coriobacteriaceae bacterium]
MSKRKTRQAEIRRVVRTERLRTQQEIADRLVRAGFPCTQATVSRDIVEMGLKKVAGGIYALPEDLHLHRMFTDLVTGVLPSEQLVIVKTLAGGAQGVAAALDAAVFPQVLGSIAGDDTVLLITGSAAEAAALVSALHKYRSGL